MFEKWRIKEHMEVVDSAGQHVGTVDEVEDGGEKGRIKLTRNDASDGAHHYLDIENVDRIDDNRVYLKSGTPLPERETSMAGTSGGMSTGSMGGAGGGSDLGGGTASGLGSSPGSDAGYTGGGTSSADNIPSDKQALFGTSGHGTGMGGSGSGAEN